MRGVQARFCGSDVKRWLRRYRERPNLRAWRIGKIQPHATARTQAEFGIGSEGLVFA